MRHFFLSVVFYIGFVSSALALECKQDTLTENSDGEMLQTLSGDIFESLGGDSITALLWLPMSDLLVCGPNLFDYTGTTYKIYEITNIDDGEKISALAIKSSSMPTQTSGGCYKSSIVKPTPFMGNNDEIFVLSDGSVWQIKYEYEYMYEYYPTIVACPDAGYVIVDGKKLNAIVLK
ncbi:hypothetical protein GN278_12190 [Rhodobacteraceae bacterium Araon29]